MICCLWELDCFHEPVTKDVAGLLLFEDTGREAFPSRSNPLNKQRCSSWEVACSGESSNETSLGENRRRQQENRAVKTAHQELNESLW